MFNSSKWQKVIALFLFACFAMSPASGLAKSYKKSLKEHVRKDEAYGRPDFYASLSWQAVWLSPAMQAAQSDLVRKIYKHTPDKHANFTKTHLLNLQGHPVFFVSFYSYDPAESNLAHKNSVWKLSLQSQGRTWQPEHIQKVSKLDSLQHMLYPFADVWSKFFLVHFPKNLDLSQPFTLRVDGPHGKSELKWD
ncbi:MAG: hypothetical protein H7A33_08145 [Deltaproteobacteria bacterium]|nr:hypothetical protein [Deltaproteobacteria bacterium]